MINPLLFGKWQNVIESLPRPGLLEETGQRKRSAKELAGDRLWVAACAIFTVTVLCLIVFRRYTRCLHQRRYEDRVAAKEKR